MDKQHAGVIGATSFVGECLVAILLQNGWRVTAFSRHKSVVTANRSPLQSSLITWRRIDDPSERENRFATVDETITVWFYLAPIWTLPERFDFLVKRGIRRIIVLSSTSIFTKVDSTDAGEREVVHRLTEGETALRLWAKNNGVIWTILRPTLIYGQGRDRNIMEIVRVIQRFGFFPLIGKACGLRQPVYVEDVAKACLAAFLSGETGDRAYNITGGETLTYREMVIRIFSALGRTPRLLQVPGWIIRLSVTMVRMLPRYRHWTVGMVERMNRNLVFDSSAAMCDFEYTPRPFKLNKSDLF